MSPNEPINSGSKKGRASFLVALLFAAGYGWRLFVDQGIKALEKARRSPAWRATQDFNHSALLITPAQPRE